MIRFCRLGIFLILIVSALSVEAQDTLPNFSIVNRGGKVILSWVNPFDSLVQISIQRSTDSLRGFKTIMTIPDATSITNGYLDSRAPNANHYYRIYVQMARGQYFFTGIKRPVLDNGTIANYTPVGNDYNGRPTPGVKDSSKIKSLDTRNLFTPSVFIFTNNDGNVVIALPESKSKQYNIKFLRENGTQLFEMEKIAEPVLTLDKSNFHHAGWFKFELYENGTLKEKNKFYIPKDR
ncbi:hypothetical protein [Pollutibacter soli]|uniref:hypothetical protein n=1 Tax=Pollutibacter soli TaxID=3034157 RepID=UPI003013F363